jgi:hypothetical protein
MRRQVKAASVAPYLALLPARLTSNRRPNLPNSGLGLTWQPTDDDLPKLQLRDQQFAPQQPLELRLLLSRDFKKTGIDQESDLHPSSLERRSFNPCVAQAQHPTRAFSLPHRSFHVAASTSCSATHRPQPPLLARPSRRKTD